MAQEMRVAGVRTRGRVCYSPLVSSFRVSRPAAERPTNKPHRRDCSANWRSSRDVEGYVRNQVEQEYAQLKKCHSSVMNRVELLS
jgi:hypothetical protein